MCWLKWALLPAFPPGASRQGAQWSEHDLGISQNLCPNPSSAPFSKVFISSAGRSLCLTAAIICKWDTGGNVAQVPGTLSAPSDCPLPVRLPGGPGAAGSPLWLLTARAASLLSVTFLFRRFKAGVGQGPPGNCSTLVEHFVLRDLWLVLDASKHTISWTRVFYKKSLCGRKTPALPLTCCVTVYESLDFSEPQFLCLWNKMISKSFLSRSHSLNFISIYVSVLYCIFNTYLYMCTLFYT